MIEAVQSSLVYIETADGSGSGFIVDETGLIVTNEHVVRGFDTVLLVLSDGSEYDGIVLGVDEIADLAVVEIQDDAGNFDSMSLGNSDDVRVGDEVIALGYPLGYDLGSELTVTRGIISSNRVRDGVDVFQTDAATAPGSSGGPLVDMYGNVIGVNYAGIPSFHDTPVDNIGFAIAIDELHYRMDFLVSGENAPMPEPEPWTTYESPTYGYSLEIAPDWYLDEESGEDEVAFWNFDYSGVIEIAVVDLSDIDSEILLDDFTDLMLTAMEELALEESWEYTEVTSIEYIEDEFGEYYLMESVTQISEDYCVQVSTTLIILSDFYPDEPYGFVVEGSVCEENLDVYADDLAEMLASFSP